MGSKYKDSIIQVYYRSRFWEAGGARFWVQMCGCRTGAKVSEAPRFSIRLDLLTAYCWTLSCSRDAQRQSRLGGGQIETVSRFGLNFRLWRRHKPSCSLGSTESSLITEPS